MAYVVGFALLAYLVDKVLTGTMGCLARRTKTTFDDRLIGLLHRPVFLTVLFVGLGLAATSLEMTAGLERFTVLSLRTILVVVWAAFAYRLVKLLLNVMRHHPDRFGMVQSSTEALLTNFMAVVFVIGGAYAILLIWESTSPAWWPRPASSAWRCRSPPRTRCRTCSPAWRSCRTSRTSWATSSCWTAASGEG